MKNHAAYLGPEALAALEAKKEKFEAAYGVQKPKAQTPTPTPTGIAYGHTFDTFADAVEFGYRRPDPKLGDVDISSRGPGVWGYQFKNGKQRSVMVTLRMERNKIGQLGVITAMFPPTPTK